MGAILGATSLNWVGKIIYNNLYKWVSTWGTDSEYISLFAITVIMFSIFLRLITLPLDLWQKILTRKNAKKMDMMKPELAKISEQCAGDKETQMRKQRELYKKYKYKTFAACLPSIVTMVIFFIVLSGFTSSVKYHNSRMFESLSATYHTTYDQKEKEYVEGGMGKTEAAEAAMKDAEAAVVAAYEPEHFLLTKNIFMPDTWKSPVPDVYTFSGTGLGKLGIPNVDRDEYNKIMKPIIREYNFKEDGKKQWNGYLILPIISILLNFGTSLLMKQPEQPPMPGQTEQQQKMQKTQGKIMQFMMPIMMGVFALLYSTAFTLYMTVSALCSLLLNVIFLIVTKSIDKKRKDHEMSVTIK